MALVNTTPVQNFIAQKSAAWLSKKLKTKVTIQHIRVDFLNHLALQGLYIEDKAHDTLLYAGEAKVRITDWFIFKDKPVLSYLSLRNTYIHQYRTRLSDEWNSDFIANAFSSPDKAAPKNDTGGKPFNLGLDRVELENVRVHLDDSWGGEDLNLDIGQLSLKAKNIDIRNKLIEIGEISIKNLLVDEKEYKGGKPPRDHSKDTIDTTPFNPDKWVVRISKLGLDACQYNLTMDDKVPVANLFDENHLVITQIKTSIKDISIIGDNIRGETQSLYAH